MGQFRLSHPSQRSHHITYSTCTTCDVTRVVENVALIFLKLRLDNRDRTQERRGERGDIKIRPVTLISD